MLYDDGVPLFSKESIRDIYQQLTGDLPSGYKIKIKGADGVVVELELKTGRAVESDDAELEFFV